MLADGSVNLPAVLQQIQLLIEGGVSAAFICGTTGEGLSLSNSERMQLAEQWVAHAPPKLPVIVHVGHTSQREAISLAYHAAQINASAIATLAPFFFKPQTVAQLVDFCAPIAAAAPAIPFYFYHLPSMTGVTLSMVDFLNQAKAKIPTFAGIKYTHSDLTELQQCLELAGDTLAILFGRDEMLLSALKLGVRGAIGSTYNYAAPVYQRLIKASQAGDQTTTQSCQNQAIQLIEILKKYGEIPAAKVIMELQGIACGPPRPPLVGLTSSQRIALREELSSLNIFTRPLNPG